MTLEVVWYVSKAADNYLHLKIKFCLSLVRGLKTGAMCTCSLIFVNANDKYFQHGGLSERKQSLSFILLSCVTRIQPPAIPPCNSSALCLPFLLYAISARLSREYDDAAFSLPSISNRFFEILNSYGFLFGSNLPECFCFASDIPTECNASQHNFDIKSHA